MNNDSITGLPNMLWSGSEFINAEDAFIHAQIEVHDDVQNMGTIKGAWTLDIQRGLFENKGSISFSNFTYTDGPVSILGAVRTVPNLGTREVSPSVIWTEDQTVRWKLLGSEWGLESW